MCCGVVCLLHKQTDGQTGAFLFTSPIHQSMASVAVLLTFWLCSTGTLPIDKCVSRVVKVPGLTMLYCLSRDTQNSKKNGFDDFQLVMLRYFGIQAYTGL